jgi:hypothetical protein
MDWGLIITILILFVALIAVYVRYADYATYMDMTRAYDRRPIIWVYVDDSDVNMRFWSDYGSPAGRAEFPQGGRSSEALNIPFLNLCYGTIQVGAGSNYRVELISGVADAIQKLGGAGHVPDRLLGAKVLTPLDMTYIRTAILERYGGLWAPLSSIFLRPVPVLPADSVVFFGTYKGDTYSGVGGSPGNAYIWSPRAGHPMMVRWADMLQRRMEEENGGSWVRGSDAQDMAAFLQDGSAVASATAVLDRKPNGKTIGIEDWMSHGTGGDLPFVLNTDAFVAHVDYEELVRRRAYGWFLKLGEEEILGSDLVISHVLRSAQGM